MEVGVLEFVATVSEDEEANVADGKGVGVSRSTSKVLWGTSHPSPKNRTDTIRLISERFIGSPFRFVIANLYQADVTSLSCSCHRLVTLRLAFGGQADDEDASASLGWIAAQGDFSSMENDDTSRQCQAQTASFYLRCIFTPV